MQCNGLDVSMHPKNIEKTLYLKLKCNTYIHINIYYISFICKSKNAFIACIFKFFLASGNCIMHGVLYNTIVYYVFLCATVFVAQLTKLSKILKST